MGELDDKDIVETQTTTEKISNSEIEAKETDKMLEDKPKTQSQSSSPKTEKKTEEILNITDDKKDKNNVDDDKKETTKTGDDDEKKTTKTDKKIAKEDREVKPKKIPIGGMKLPGFFTKSKPKTEGDGADGELLEKEPNIEEQKPKNEEKIPCLGARIKNFFIRKPVNKKVADENAKNDTTNQDETAPPPQKKGLLNAIKLPIANMIPRKKTEDDVELGNGPGTKAGLASMETLDDSLKDQDQVDKAPVKADEKLDKEKEAKDEEEHNNKVPFFQRIRSYRCSLDDALIALGALSFVALLAVIGYVLFQDKPTTPPIRKGKYIDAVTSCGMVEGLKEDSSFAFRGIPYAIPPVNGNRFRPARLIDSIENCWNGTLKAHNATPVCSQLDENGKVIGVEDCLHLDVITPYVRYYNLLPVVVLIGANTYTEGSPGLLRPSARYARSRDVVFVRPNFRMGPLGFLAVEALSKDSYPQTSGNYALSDILAVLKWIQLNIENFGGNPKAVTLVGHRAGGTLVQALITSKKAKNLYDRAWVSSPSAFYPGKPLHESERKNQELMNMLDCKTADCLRKAPVKMIWDAVPDTWRHYPTDLPKSNDEGTSSSHEWLVLDGEILTQHPADVWKKDAEGKLKLVIGTTAHESHNKKLRGRYENWTAEEIRQHLDESKIGSANLTDEVLKLYNATNYESLVAIISDIRTICPLLINARMQPNVPFYVVTRTDTKYGNVLADVSMDIQGILGRYEPRTVEERRYVSAIQQLFFHYVSHGTMSQYQPRQRVLNIGQDPLSMADYPNCNFWIKHDFVPRFAKID